MVVILILAIIVAVLLGVFHEAVTSNLPVIGNYVVLVVNILLVVYQKNLAFYRIISGIRLFITNAQINWSLKVIIRGDFDEQIFKNWIKEIRSCRENNAQILLTKKDIETINIEGMIIEQRYFRKGACEYSGENEQAEMHIYIPDYVAAYIHSRDRLVDGLLPMISKLRQQVFNGVKVTEEYSVTAKFMKTNPFLGHFVNKIGINQIVGFTCNIRESHPRISRESYSDIEITRKYLQISSNDLDAIRSSLEKYLLI